MLRDGREVRVPVGQATAQVEVVAIGLPGAGVRDIGIQRMPAVGGLHRAVGPGDRAQPPGDAGPGRRSAVTGGQYCAQGLYARIAQRLLAMAAAIWHNWATGEPVKRSLTAYDN